MYLDLIDIINKLEISYESKLILEYNKKYFITATVYSNGISDGVFLYLQIKNNINSKILLEERINIDISSNYKILELECTINYIINKYLT